ncbi:MAG: hypothetical protein ACE5PV_19270, partial [Candidatus Poribacteria bacterium]
AATFIAKHYCTPVDVDELESAFKKLMEKVKPEMDWLYETRCDRCGGKATTGYVVWSEQFRCERCLNIVPLYDCPKQEITTYSPRPRRERPGEGEGKTKKVRVCPKCLANGYREPIDTGSQKFGAVPVEVSYLCEMGCKPTRANRTHNDENERKREYFEKYDLGKLEEIEGLEIPYWYPRMNMPYGKETKRLYNAELERVDTLFTKRNLWALAGLKEAITSIRVPEMDALALTFQGNLLQGTIMQQYRESGGGHQKGTYYVPPLFVERKQSDTFSRKYKQIKRSYSALKELYSNGDHALNISTQSATDLHQIPANAIDYIFTDPPYNDKVQFGELNFVWETWLGFDTSWLDKEIIVNEVREKTEKEWATMMQRAMSEAFRALKPGRWLTLCYHDTSEGTWGLIQEIMSDAGFVPDKSESVSVIDTKQKSYNQLMANKVMKRDLVINFRKPRADELPTSIYISEADNAQSIQQKVKEVTIKYLQENPGQTIDHIWDYVVSYLVRRGQMERHDFESVLEEVALESDENRWFLKDEFEEVTPSEREKEDQAGAVIEAFARETMENEGLQSVDFSDIFEHYLYAVKEKPRRELKAFITDYLIPAGKGYRPPVDEAEREALQKARQAGLNLNIRRFVRHLTEGAPFPEHKMPDSSTLADWIRHCRRFGLDSEGVVLFEKGGLRLFELSEEMQVEVQEDYMVCRRRAREEK